jgi:hypothetical protein
MNINPVEHDRRVGRRPWGLAVVVAGIVIGQFLLYGPSLVGRKILLPLDILAVQDCYSPATSDGQTPSPHDRAVTDLILQFEPNRLFAAREFRAGRFPLWTPHEYGGAPFIAPKYSPFFLLTCLTESPRMLPWGQLLQALVAGTGGYFFCRRALRVGFWPATLAAWCYPLTAFFVLWQGFPTSAPVYWLPWLLLAVDRTARGNRMAPVALAVVTGLALVSGHVDVAGQVLLVSGLYALWCLWDVYRPGPCRRAPAKGALLLAAGWGLGFLLAAPHLLPLLEYARTGARMEQRAAGFEARPPLGLGALPQVVLPNMYGSTERGAFPLVSISEPSLQESAAAAYTGLLATLVVAPLAWYSRRHRSINGFWILLAVFGLSWCTNMVGIVDLLRLPGLNMMSHNRLVFATSFAILALTAIGLEAWLQGLVQWRWQCWLQLALLVGLFGWCLYRSEVLPEQLTSPLEKVVETRGRFTWIRNMEGLKQAQAWFCFHYRMAAAWCAVGVLVWLLLKHARADRRGSFVIVSGLLLSDLLLFDCGRNLQSDPAQYFPGIPALRDLVKAASGRIIGYDCFPANLAQVLGLRDARGYDSVDPGRWWALVRLTADERSIQPEYAKMQWLFPKVKTEGTNTLHLSPVLDALTVQYVIFRGKPPPQASPTFQSPDYWVMENRSALPRVFVPRQVEVVPDGNEMLYRLGLPEFDPREIAYVEAPVSLPSDCRGTGEVTEEMPNRVVVTARMETPGLLVLADAWDGGWRAFVNCRRVPVLRTDYAIRGVALPAGSAAIEFRYQPASLAFGACLAGAAVVMLMGWVGMLLWNRRERLPSGNNRQPRPET